MIRKDRVVTSTGSNTEKVLQHGGEGSPEDDPPDGGWGWMVVAGSYILSLFLVCVQSRD